MKPSFALTLCEGGIGLMHRARDGWRSLGDVSLDDPGLGETLRLMRGTAETLADGPLRTKLVIPDSQILYTTLPLAGQSRAEKRAALKRGLDGLTPYAVDDLVFDWHEEGETAHLAVVARETLAEAEAFACEHAFNPVCFVAAPTNTRFDGEPFFGPTEIAATLLPKGTRAEADTAPLRPGGGAPEAPPPRKSASKAKTRAKTGKPKDATTAKAKPARLPTFASRHRAEGAPPPTTAPDSAQTPPAHRLTLGPPIATAVPGTDAGAPPAGPDISALAGATLKRLAGVVPVRLPKREKQTPPRDEAETAIPRATVPPAPPSAPATLPSESETPAAAAPIPTPVAPAPAPPEPVVPAKPDQPKAPAAQSPALSSPLEEALRAMARPAPTARPAVAPDRPASPIAPRAQAPSKPRDEVEAMTVFGARKPDGLAPTPGLNRGVLLGAALAVFLAVIVLWTLLLPGDDPAGVPAPQNLAAAPDAAPVTPPPALDSAPPEAPLPLDPTPTPAPPPSFSRTDAAEAYASTGIWQLAPDPPVAPPQDRIEDLYVAALDPSIRPPQSVTLPDPQVTRATDMPLPMQSIPPGPEHNFVVDSRGLVTATPEGALTPEGVTVFAGPPELTPPPRPEGLAPEPVPEPAPTAAPTPAPQTVPEAVATPALEGVQVIPGAPSRIPPPRPEGLAPDPDIVPVVTPPQAPAAEAEIGTEAEAPTDPAATEMAAPPQAPAPGAVVVIPGAPALTPPDRPEGLAPAPAATPDPDPAAPAPPAEEGAAAQAVQPPQTAQAALPGGAIIASDPETATRLAPFRPRLRPAGIVQAAQPVPPAPPAPVPTMRPRERPVALAPPPADTPDAEAEEAAAPATEESPQDNAEEVTLARSLRPAARPSDFAERLVPTAPAVPAVAAAPAPSIPTSASVAKQATVPNGINLRKVNLIGVYGTANDRRALVRLANGRYIKVKVGDKVDGGTVAAIGEDQLRYVRSGRNIVLELPGG